jgi:hypothetical protein
MNVPQKYGVVRVIALVLKILAWVALVGGLVTAVATSVAVGNVSGSAAGLASAIRSIGLIVGPVVGIVWFVQLYAFGSILSLLIDIEENTRVLSAEASAYPAPLEVS